MNGLSKEIVAPPKILWHFGMCFLAAELGYRLDRAVLTDAIKSKEVQMCLRPNVAVVYAYLHKSVPL